MRRLVLALGAVFGVLFVGATVAEAGTVAAEITGDTVTFSGSGFEPNSKVKVTIKNEETGSSTNSGPFITNGDGCLRESTGTTGDTIAPGTSVTVTVYSIPGGDNLGSTTVDAPGGTGAISRVIGLLLDWIL